MIFLLLAKASSYSYLDYSSIVSRFDSYNLNNWTRSLLPSSPLPAYLLGGLKQGLPNLLLIGGFHGDEVTGSVAITQFVELLNLEMSFLREKVNILVVPVANPSGYQLGQRVTSQKIDPNRDFPYDSDLTRCCLTDTCQGLMALYDSYDIWLTLTFHGGEWSITYPPGDNVHQNKDVLDQGIFKQLTASLRRAIFDDPFREGSMRDVIYSVHGSFEDWAYFWGWSRPEAQSKCGPDSKKKVGLVLLVENGQKWPSRGWGRRDYFLSLNKQDYGYVPRTAELITAAVEWLSPTLVVFPADQTAFVTGCSPAIVSITYSDNSSRILRFETPYHHQPIPLSDSIASVDIVCEHSAFQSGHLRLTEFHKSKVFTSFRTMKRSVVPSEQAEHVLKWVAIGVLIILGLGCGGGFFLYRWSKRVSQFRPQKLDQYM